MPHTAYDLPVQKAEIIARVTAGETVSAICTEAGKPRARAVFRWARADAAFRAALDQALSTGTWRRRRMFDEAKAAAFLARLRAGEGVHALWRDPTMPSRHTYAYWKVAEPAFAEAIHLLRRAQRTTLAARAVAHARPWDPDTGDRIVGAIHRTGRLRASLKADPTLPCYAIVARWRREQPEFDGAMRFVIEGWRRRRRRLACGCTPDLTEAIAARIVEGQSLLSLSREPGMPSASTLYRWIATRPDFAAVVAQACEHREHWYLDQMIDLAERGGAAAKPRVAALSRQLARLKHRPGGRRDGAARQG